MAFRDGQTLLVAFAGRQVAVHSHVTAVSDGVCRLFASMMATEPGDVVAELVVEQDSDRYVLYELGSAPVVGYSMVNILDHVSFVVTERLVHAHTELLWLHAACAATEATTVIIAAPWGHGKSTIATGLASLGWSLLSDDLVPIDQRSGIIHAFPRLPMVRQDPGRVLSRDELSSIVKIESLMVGQSGFQRVDDLGAIVFPRFVGGGRSALVPCAPSVAALELLKQCRNFLEHRESGVRYLAKLATRVPAFRLTYGDGDDAARRLDHTVRAEATSTPV